MIKYMHLKIGLNILGNYNIEKLNLNIIFESNNEKYILRHLTADWKFDNNMKSINNDIINYKKLVEQQLTGFNEKTRIIKINKFFVINSINIFRKINKFK